MAEPSKSQKAARRVPLTAAEMRAKAAYRAMEKLMEGSFENEARLWAVARVMSGEEFLAAAEERTLAGMCGNATCSQPPRVDKPQGKYRIDPREQKVYEALQGPGYCSEECAVAAAAFGRRLGGATQAMQRFEQLLEEVKSRRRKLSQMAGQMSELSEQAAPPEGSSAQDAVGPGKDGEAAAQSGLKSVLKKKPALAAGTAKTPIMAAEVKERDPGPAPQPPATLTAGSAKKSGAVEGYVPKGSLFKPSSTRQRSERKVRFSDEHEAQHASAAPSAVMGVDNGESSGMEVVGGTEDHGNSAENGKESTRWRPVFVFDIDEGNGSAAGSNGNAAVLSTKMGQLRVVDADDLDLPATSTQNGAPDADGSMEAHAGLETRAAQTPDIDEILAERLRQGAKRYFPQLAATLPAELNAMLDDSASEAGSSEGGSEDWMLSDDDGDAETDLRETHAQVSFFGQLHMHMDAWVTGETLDLLHSGPEAPAPSGRMSGTVPEIHTALGRFVSTALPPVMDGLKVGVPRGEVEKGLGDVLRTLRLTGALPAFSSMQWQVLVVVLLKALSMERLPSLRPSFETREGIQRLGQTLAASSFTIEELYAVLELLLDPDA